MSTTKFTGFMSGAGQYGRWVPPAEISAKAIMGGATVDFSQALFTHSVYTVYTKAFWGGVTLIVPPNVAVEQNGHAIMGGFGGSGGLFHSSGGQMAETVSNAGIIVKVEGTAVMGAVSVTVNQMAAPAQLITAEEAARILREVPAQPSTTKEDVRRQAIEKALGSLGGARGDIVQGVLGARLGGGQSSAAVATPVQGVPVEK
mmetsp:Transcript_8522/g.18163  ORF Transcript_8522/g.18163 Transcript_8522/m.18163 type:complete len:202 (-) Transcript_8522:164-769(-)